MATKHRYQCSWKEWSYGAELELVDWPCRESLPKGMAIDHAEAHNVNSNGVAVDGTGKLYHLGGEILTTPSTRVEGPAEQYQQIKDRWPQAAVNYRMGLNVHVRVPGLRDNLSHLKKVQSFCAKVLPHLLLTIDPIPQPDRQACKGARENYRKRKRDHHTVVPSWRLALQHQAQTPQEFFETEVIHQESGRLCWAIVPRNCVNLRQLLQTDTVEFRHFFMPTTPEELQNAVRWCKLFLEVALGEDGGMGGEANGKKVAEGLLREFGEFGFLSGQTPWPRPMPYDPWLDRGWRYTNSHHNPPADVPRLIREWVNSVGQQTRQELENSNG